MKYDLDAKFPKIFRAWLAEDPENRRNRLILAGVRAIHIPQLAADSGTGNFLLMYLDKIEKETGIDVKQVLFLEAKRQLWGKDDKLPKVETFQELMDELQSVIGKHGAGQTKKLLQTKFDIKRWTLRKSTPSLKSIKKILVLVHTNNSPESPSAIIREAEEAEGKPVEDKEPRDPRRAISSCISMLNSGLNLLEEIAPDPQIFVEGDWTNILRVVRKLFKISGIDEAALKKLQSSQPITRADRQLFDIIGAMNRR